MSKKSSPKPKAISPKTEKHPGGRPSIYTPELGQRICELISQSTMGLNRLAKKYPELPAPTTVISWLLDGKHPEFSKQYAQAREEQAEFMCEEILDIADDGSNDTMIEVGKDGTEYVKENKEWTNRSKLRVDARKWLASKLKPKKYGDKLELSGEMNIKTVSETTNFTLKAKK